MRPVKAFVQTLKTDSLGAVFCFLSLIFPLLGLWNAKALVPLIVVGAVWAAVILVRDHAVFSPWRNNLMLSTAMALFFALAVVMAPLSNDPGTAYVSVLKLGGSILIFAIISAAAMRLTDDGVRAAMSCLMMASLVAAGLLAVDV